MKAPRDFPYAIAIGVVALGLYVATLQPDFGGPEDTPKFQFIGHVLGTPHPPGYPLYVLLSHLFVKLPLGTIAYRANLFSGVMTAVACALAYLIDMALQYFSLTGEGGEDRGIVRVGYEAAAVREATHGTGSDGGPRVFAFAGAATFLGAEGLRFDRALLVGPSLDEWLKDLPDSTFVVGSAAYMPVPSEFSRLARRVGRARSFTAFALTTGRSGAAWREGDSPIAQVDAGVALAVFAKDGALLRAIEFSSGEPLRVPFEEALYELKAEAHCVDVTTEDWSDVTSALTSGSWLATLPALGSVTIESAIAGVSGSSARVLRGDGSVHDRFRTNGSAQSVPHDRLRTTGSARQVPHERFRTIGSARRGAADGADAHR